MNHAERAEVPLITTSNLGRNGVEIGCCEFEDVLPQEHRCHHNASMRNVVGATLRTVAL